MELGEVEFEMEAEGRWNNECCDELISRAELLLKGEITRNV